MRTCLILGGADTLHDDLAAYAGPRDGVVACNDAGAVWPGDLDAWVSFHPRYWISKGWLAKRADAGFTPARRMFASDAKEAGKAAAETGVRIDLTEWAFPGQAVPEASITSGFFAVKVALVDLGFDQAVLCGIPMTNGPHFFDPEPWMTARRYAKRLPNIPAEYRARIRSMSGETRKFFGAPD